MITLVKPSYDEETLSHYFRPPSPELWSDPLVGPILRQLQRDDPDIIAAVSDVDRSLIRDSLALEPWQRLVTSCAWTETLAGFRRVSG